MAKYTTEVRSICEELSGFGQGGYADVNQIIAEAVPQIFDFTFPIFDENYRLVLETGILRHFYTREIGFETVGLWKLKLMTKLNEIMPYYNQYYESQKIKFNPMNNVDVTTTNTLNRDVTQSDKTDSSAETSNTREIKNSGTDYDLLSLTPQGGLSGVDSMEYLTEARAYQNGKVVNDDDSGESSGTVNYDSKIGTVEEYTNHILGKNSGESFSDLLIRFRETFISVDMMVMRDLEELFMGVW